MNGRRQAAVLAKMKAQLERPRFLRIVATILVHDRREQKTGERCPCCRSINAEIVERRAVDDIVIDCVTGDRIRAGDRSPGEWAALCKAAALHPVDLRCSVKTLPLLLDDTPRHIFASGGHRAQKTTTGLAWISLQWIRRGGRECRFWLVARTDEDAFRLLEKLFKGTGESPPILPAWLISKSPQTFASRDLMTTLVDGSLIDLRSFDNDPGAKRLKSDSVVAALVDEAAHLPSPSSLAALRGRCMDVEGGGRLWLASTPVMSSFLKAEVVDPAAAFAALPVDSEQRRAVGDLGTGFRVEPLAMLANPWIPIENIETAMKTVDMSKPENRRDYLGEWVASEGRCWTDWDDARHKLVHEARDVARLAPAVLASVGAAGHVPVTTRVAKALFGKSNPHYKPARASNFRYILGQDVNLHPAQAVLLQVTAPADSPEDRDRWHVWVVDCVTTDGNTLEHARRMAGDALAGIMDPFAQGTTIKNCGIICDASALGKTDPHASRHGQTGSLAETFGKLGFDVRAPIYKRTPNSSSTGAINGPRSPYFTLIHRLLDEGRLHVFSRCGPLLHAFEAQIVEPDGNCPVDSRRGMWDQVMGPMDAFRYALLAIMTSGEVETGPAPVVDWGG